MLRLALILICLLNYPAHAADEFTISHAQLQELGHSNAWLRILYYVPRWTQRRTGMIDTDGFYLSPSGDTDPVAELAATIAAFQAPTPSNADDHALCKFPLRRKYLSAHIDMNRLHLPAPPCKAYNDWREAFPVIGASLVFSSNYLNNPASMYGHTFLRLQRKANDQRDASPLLDYAVNFAANPTTDNPFLYPALGLTGRFFGTFSLMPYYLKVQEYNNAESRDLWEFPLNFSDDEVDSLMMSLWEVGPHGIRYYYFDENCSFVLLATIAAAKPELNAVDHFPNVVSPKDTVTELIPYHGIGTPVRRLSALSRFEARRAKLNATEADLLSRQSHAEYLLAEVSSLPPESAARFLDALLEWISFREKLAGNRTVETYKVLWSETLAARAKLGIASETLVGDINIDSRPEIGHPAQRFTFGVRGAEKGSPSFVFGFRFTLHDTLSPSAGYSRDQEITMGDFNATVLRTNSGKPKVMPDRGTIIRILSIPSSDLLTKSIAWTLTFGADRVYGPDDSSWMIYHLEAGPGVAYDVTPRVKLYAIPVFNIGLLTEGDKVPDGGIGARFGFLVDASQSLKLGITTDLDSVKASPIMRTWSSRAFVSKDLGPLWEVRAEATRRSYQPNTGALTVFRYF